MSVARAREINARLRAAGITVHVAPGADSRGNGQSSDYEGGLVHHTASGFAVARPGTGIYDLLVRGRSDLAGPLCNWAGNSDGSVTYIAAHPANHAGASGGRSMGPLPVTSLFNKRVMGLEIVYPGDKPMRTAQYRTALIWSRIVTAVLGSSNIQRARAHAETSITGKWDPGFAPGRTIDMTAFRKAALITSEDDMTPEQAKQLDYNTRVGVENQRRIGQVRADIAALRTLVIADKDIDPAQLERMLNEAVAEYTPTAEETAAVLLPLVEGIAERVLGADNKALAAEFLRQLRESLPTTEGN